MTDVTFAAVDKSRLAVASQWQLMWWAFKRHRLAMVGLWVVGFFYLIALIPGFFSSNDPSAQNARAAYHPPQRLHIIDEAADGSWKFNLHIRPYVLRRDPTTLAAIYVEDPNRKVDIQFFTQGYEWSFFGLFKSNLHLFGTGDARQPLFLLGADRLGRCVWSRIMQGTQISLSVGLVGVFLSLVLGVVLGGISGYFGGKIDFSIQRVIEFVLSLPTIPIWLAMAAALPQDWPATLNYFMITLILSSDRLGAVGARRARTVLKSCAPRNS